MVVLSPSLLLALAVPTFTVGAQDDSIGAAPWWGGEVSGLERALDQAGDWARGWTETGDSVRVWVETTTGAVVSCATSDRKLGDDVRRVEAIALRAVEKGVGVASFDGRARAEATYVLEGAESLDAGSPVLSEPPLTLRTAKYSTEERPFVIALCMEPSRSRIEVRGRRRIGDLPMEALGILQVGPGGIEGRINRALAVSSAPLVVVRAATQALAGSSRRAAEKVLGAASGMPCPIDPEVLNVLSALERLTATAEAPFSELAGLADRASVARVLASRLRTAGHAGEPLLVLDRRGLAILMACGGEPTSDLGRRDAVRSLVDESGRVALPAKSLTVSGNPAACRPSTVGVERPGLELGSGWVLISQADAPDPRLQPGLERVVLPTQTLDRSAAIEVALARTALDRGLYRAISLGCVQAISSSRGLRALVPWAVRRGDMWEVDLASDVPPALALARSTPRFEYRLELPQAYREAASALHVALKAEGGVPAADAPLFHVVVAPGSTETGVDPGEGLLCERPWRRQRVEVRLSSPCFLNDLVFEGRTDKVYGAHGLETHVERVGRSLIQTAAKDLVQHLREGLDGSRRIRVRGDVGELEQLRSLAAPFGPGQLNRASRELEVRWPRGEAGLQTFREALELSPNVQPLVSLEVIAS
ncbi:hypothetical protein N9L90_03040 [Planctomycetota bacterium]|nr:hypothetical protein [Planctomycetota bacterium]